MPIRDAVPTDLPEIAALIRELAEYERMLHEVEWQTDDHLAEHLFGERPVASVLIAEAEPAASAPTAQGDAAAEGDAHGAPEVVGFALWYPTFSTFEGRPGIWLEDLFVRPAHRGHGYGRDLIFALRDRTEGRVEWTVLDWNEPSIAFYRALGARPMDGWTTYRWVLDR